MEGGRRFMVAWRKEEVDATRHRQEKRKATRLGRKLLSTWYRTRKRRTCEATGILFGRETGRDLRSAYYGHADRAQF